MYVGGWLQGGDGARWQALALVVMAAAAAAAPTPSLSPSFSSPRTPASPSSPSVGAAAGAAASDGEREVVLYARRALAVLAGAPLMKRSNQGVAKPAPGPIFCCPPPPPLLALPAYYSVLGAASESLVNAEGWADVSACLAVVLRGGGDGREAGEAGSGKGKGKGVEGGPGGATEAEGAAAGRLAVVAAVAALSLLPPLDVGGACIRPSDLSAAGLWMLHRGGTPAVPRILPSAAAGGGATGGGATGKGRMPAPSPAAAPVPILVPAPISAAAAATPGSPVRPTPGRLGATIFSKGDAGSSTTTSSSSSGSSGSGSISSSTSKWAAKKAADAAASAASAALAASAASAAAPTPTPALSTADSLSAPAANTPALLAACRAALSHTRATLRAALAAPTAARSAGEDDAKEAGARGAKEATHEEGAGWEICRALCAATATMLALVDGRVAWLGKEQEDAAAGAGVGAEEASPLHTAAKAGRLWALLTQLGRPDNVHGGGGGDGCLALAVGGGHFG